MTNGSSLVTINAKHCGVEATPGLMHRVVHVHGGPVSVYEAGSPDRQSVVLLHGAMCDEARFIWDQLFPVLAEEFRVVAVDTPRHGRSRPWTGPLGRERLVQILHGTLDEAGLARTAIVGLSMGGGLAIEFAARYPQRVTCAVLFEPGGLADRLDRQLLTWLYIKTPGLSRIIGRWYATKTRAGLRDTLDSLYVGGAKPTDPERLLDILHDEIEGKRRYSERDLDDWQIEAIGPRRTWTLLNHIPRLACPTLWLRGADSAVVKQDEMERVLSLATQGNPQASVVVIPGAGHLLPLERPAEVEAAVLPFLREHAAGERRGQRHG